MTLIVELGTGNPLANSYVGVAAVTAYLTDRNRETQNAWSTRTVAEQEAAVVAASDFIDFRFGQRFLGIREFRNYLLKAAAGALTATAQFIAAETVTIGVQTYTFVAVLAAADDILIGVDARDSLVNLVAAINDGVGGAGEGTLYGTGTVVNADVTALVNSSTDIDQMIVTAKVLGSAANQIVTTETSAGASWAFPVLTGGGDLNDVQGLEFPRLALVTADAQRVLGIPVRLKEATAEYSVRAVVGTALQPDPTFDPRGGAVVGVKEKVGPVETELRYSEGSTLTPALRAYPAADRLLRAYIAPPGVIR